MARKVLTDEERIRRLKQQIYNIENGIKDNSKVLFQSNHFEVSKGSYGIAYLYYRRGYNRSKRSALYIRTSYEEFEKEFLEAMACLKQNKPE